MEHGLDVNGHENSLSALTQSTAEVVAWDRLTSMSNTYLLLRILA
jgi:hypothetical protein